MHVTVHTPTARTGQLLGSAVLVVLGAGLVAAAAGAWRPGLLTVGGALIVAATVRLFLPDLPLASLTVRAGWLDAAVLVSMAAVLVAAALALP